MASLQMPGPDLFVRPQIFIRVESNQPDEPYEKSRGDPFQCGFHFYSIIHKTFFLAKMFHMYMTEIWKKVTVSSLQ